MMTKVLQFRFGRNSPLKCEIISKINQILNKFAKFYLGIKLLNSFFTFLIERNKSSSNDGHRNKVLLVLMMFLKSNEVEMIKISILAGGSIHLEISVICELV